MNHDLGLKIGQTLADLTRRVEAFEAKAQVADVGPPLSKMIDGLTDQINSAADQAALSQLDTQKAIVGAAKMIAEALDRNTEALKGHEDGKEEHTA